MIERSILTAEIDFPGDSVTDGYRVQAVEFVRVEGKTNRTHKRHRLTEEQKVDSAPSGGTDFDIIGHVSDHLDQQNAVKEVLHDDGEGVWWTVEVPHEEE